MDHNEPVAYNKNQEDPAVSPMLVFDKEKLAAMQKQVLEVMSLHGSSQQCSSQGQTNVPKEPVKRQVAEAWKKMKANEGESSKKPRIRYQCQCCQHYGFPCLRN